MELKPSGQVQERLGVQMAEDRWSGCMNSALSVVLSKMNPKMQFSFEADRLIKDLQNQEWTGAQFVRFCQSWLFDYSVM